MRERDRGSSGGTEQNARMQCMCDSDDVGL